MNENNTVSNRRMDRLLNATPILFSELFIGCIFTIAPAYPDKYTVTMIDKSGKIELTSYEHFDQPESITIYRDIKQIFPVEIDNFIHEIEGFFILISSNRYEYDFAKETIYLYKGILDNHWTIEYNNKKDGIEIKLPLYYFHELQNIFQIITQRKLIIGNKYEREGVNND